MDENQVIAALCPFLEREGYRIKQRLSTIEHGVDVIAEQAASGKTLYIEAKGGTSSRLGSPRHGKPYTQTQVFDRVAKGVFTGLQMLQRYQSPDTDIALAFPAGRWEQSYLSSIAAPLKILGV